MNSEDIKDLVEQTIIRNKFPEFANVQPMIQSGPSESKLRALRRTRAVISDTDIKKLPVEHQLTYRLSEDENNPFDKTLVVVTDDNGEPQYFVESK